ncbi:hypothetical protein ACJZ2D_004801 [Fusarium nematophilum]
MMLGQLVLAAMSLLITYLFMKLHFKRFKQYAHIPQLPPSLIWGHMLVYDKFSKRGPKDQHPDLIFARMYEALGRPPLLLVDMRPVSKPVALTTIHVIAEQVSKSSSLVPWSPPKTPNIVDLIHLIGPHSILSGQEWKTLRKRFAPGFAPTHLMNLLPCILDKMDPFIDHLNSLVLSGKDFSLQNMMTNLTIDIISAVVMDEDLGAQHRGIAAECTLHQKFEEHQARRSNSPSRSILSLSFHGIDTLSPKVLDYTCDQLKSFFLTGYDTTSILLAWTFYELSRNPHAQQAVCNELNKLFGSDPNPDIVRSKLYSGGEDLI